MGFNSGREAGNIRNESCRVLVHYHYVINQGYYWFGNVSCNSVINHTLVFSLLFPRDSFLSSTEILTSKAQTASSTSSAINHAKQTRSELLLQTNCYLKLFAPENSNQPSRCILSLNIPFESTICVLVWQSS